MSSERPFKAVIAGGGPAAVEAALALRELAPQVEVVLLAPEEHLVHRPLSVATPFAHGEARRYELARLGEEGVDVVRDGLARVDADAREVHVTGGGTIAYDALLVATGAVPRPEVPRALTFEGPDYAEAMHGLVQDIEGGYTSSVAFVAPSTVTWTLPLYELALQTAARADESSLDRVRLTLVSAERRPLEVLGDEGSDRVARLLERAGIGFVPGTAVPAAGRVVALPALAGRRIPGLPHDGDGFLPVDEHMRVPGAPGVWGAGDGTTSVPKHGGLATQQAEAAARAIAAASGAPVEPEPYRPVLRAMLLTGREPLFFSRDLADGGTEVSETPLWDPPTKIAGRRLGPFLERLDRSSPAGAPPRAGRARSRRPG